MYPDELIMELSEAVGEWFGDGVYSGSFIDDITFEVFDAEKEPHRDCIVVTDAQGDVVTKIWNLYNVKKHFDE